jgi:hypothetical protein
MSVGFDTYPAIAEDQETGSIGHELTVLEAHDVGALLVRESVGTEEAEQLLAEVFGAPGDGDPSFNSKI